MQPAILLLEFDSIAVGIEVGDAMAKRSPLLSLHAGTVHPGKYLVLAGGEVADVEEAWSAGRDGARGVLLDEIFLAEVDPQVVSALTGSRCEGPGEALGVIETTTVAAAIRAADAAVKGAHVDLLEICLADGLGGKGYFLLGGNVSSVQAGVEVATARLAGTDALVASSTIAQLHSEMRENLNAHPHFLPRVRSGGSNR